MRETRKCEVCGKGYIAIRGNQKYCSKECGKKKFVSYATERNNNLKVVRKRKRNKNKNQDIIDVAVAAREAGMSYGQYVAQMSLMQNKRNKEEKRGTNEKKKDCVPVSRHL